MSDAGLLFSAILDITLTYSLLIFIINTAYPILNKALLDTVKA